MSKNDAKFYIDGEWAEPADSKLHDVINPATGRLLERFLD